MHAPWHLVASIPGTGMLVLWSAGLAAAGGLLCYAVTAPLELSLFISGVLLAASLWWGPGSDRLRSPLNRLVAPLARRPGPWLVTVLGLLAFAASVSFWVASHGVSWTPARRAPSGSSRVVRPLVDLSATRGGRPRGGTSRALVRAAGVWCSGGGGSDRSRARIVGCAPRSDPPWHHGAVHHSVIIIR